MAHWIAGNHSKEDSRFPNISPQVLRDLYCGYDEYHDANVCFHERYIFNESDFATIDCIWNEVIHGHWLGMRYYQRALERGTSKKLKEKVLYKLSEIDRFDFIDELDFIDDSISKQRAFNTFIQAKQLTIEDIDSNTPPYMDMLYRHHEAMMLIKRDDDRGRYYARQLLRGNVEEGFFLSYIGLAALETEDETKKIHMLMIAAGNGIPEGWRALTEYPRHPYLTKNWSYLHIDTLWLLTGTINGRENMSYKTDCMNCELCQECVVESMRRHVNCKGYHVRHTIGSSQHKHGTTIQKVTQRMITKQSKNIVLKSFPIEMKKMFDREYEILSKLQESQEIVKCYGYTTLSTSPTLPAIVMEHAPYGNLATFLEDSVVKQFMKSGTESSIALRIRWMTQILRAITHIHSQSIVHGDIHPTSMLVCADMNVKVAGFSSAQLIDTTESVGTSDELVAESAAGTRMDSDVRAFGMTCLHIIHGKVLRNRPIMEQWKWGYNWLLEYDKSNGCEKLRDAMDMIRKCLNKTPSERPRASHCLTILEPAYLDVSRYDIHKDTTLMFEDSLRYLIQKAKQGDPRAALKLGLRYERGELGYPKNTEKALIFYEYGGLSHRNDDSEPYAIREKRFLCGYRRGTLLCELERFEEARDEYGHLVQSGYYRGFLGLASLSRNDKEKVFFLSKAAENGVKEAWVLLQQYLITQPELLGTALSSADMMTLQTMTQARDALNKLIPYERDIEKLRDCDICYDRRKPNEERRELSNDPKEILSKSHIRENAMIGKGKFIGKGGFGEILLHSMELTNSTIKPVALKHCLINRNNIILEKELHTLRLMQGCNDIVQCYGHTILGDDLYVVMEYACYWDLDVLIKHDAMKTLMMSYNPLSIALIIRWLYQIACGIEYMHRFHIQHCDIKPKNILVFDNLHVKLTDLGISMQSRRSDDDIDIEEISFDSHFSISTLTTDMMTTTACSSITGTVNAGSPFYMAPELMEHRPTVQSDMYAFGMTCVHIINGKVLEGMSRVKQAQEAKKILNGYEGIPCIGGLIRLIEDCTALDPVGRPSADRIVPALTRMKVSLQKYDDEIEQFSKTITDPLEEEKTQM